MSRGKGTRMASHRPVAAHAAISPTHPRAASPAPAAPASTAPGQASLKRAALYARVSTEKQEREDTVASQVDLLYKAAAKVGYDITPTSVFIDEGVSGSRLDRPALDRLRDLAAEGVFEALLVTTPDRLARRYAFKCSWSRSSIADVIFSDQSCSIPIGNPFPKYSLT